MATEGAQEPGPGAPPSDQVDAGLGAPMKGGTLLVWDYDWSLINTNSDTWVVEQLRPELMERFGTARGMGWTQLMDYQMQGLFERGVRREELLACVAGVPCFEGCIAAMRLCHERGVEQVILSDANTAFIESFLAQRDLRTHIRAVLTNPAEFDEEGRLHVKPYRAAAEPPHGCPLCPPNMCKGAILERVRAEVSPARVVYVGDGGMDFCPCCDLSAGDAVLCRAPPSPPLDSFGLHARIRGSRGPYCTRHDGGKRPAQVVAQVYPWRTGEELLSAMTEILAEQPRASSAAEAASNGASAP